MEVIERKDVRNRPSMIKGEISSLEVLISRRHTWLNKPDNKLRTTHPEILKDTNEMEDNLVNLRQELEMTEKRALA